MGRGQNSIQAATALACRPHLNESSDEAFGSVFGSSRGSDREDDPTVASQQTTLPYRTVTRSTTECIPVIEDRLVANCESCGDGSFLKRNWNDKEIPALCLDCYGEQTGDSNDTCCEDWCGISIDHTGLCQLG